MPDSPDKDFTNWSRREWEFPVEPAMRDTDDVKVPPPLAGGDAVGGIRIFIPPGDLEILRRCADHAIDLEPGVVADYHEIYVTIADGLQYLRARARALAAAAGGASESKQDTTHSPKAPLLLDAYGAQTESKWSSTPERRGEAAER